MTKLTDQEAFNKVWDWFVVQKHERSIDEDDDCCMYRTDDGRRCAVGVLIPDELYDPRIEKQDIKTVLREDPAIAAYFDDITPGLLNRMQVAHDTCFPSIKDVLCDIAVMYGLTVPGRDANA